MVNLICFPPAEAEGGSLLYCAGLDIWKFINHRASPCFGIIRPFLALMVLASTNI